MAEKARQEGKKPDSPAARLDGERWSDRARRIQALAQTGSWYTTGPFDLERYRELSRIAAEMLADLGNGDVVEVERAIGLESGYSTPKVDVRGVVFDDAGRILMVREVDDGLWSLPGGWADGGDTPGEVAVREIREESGFETRATKLLAVYDRDRQGHPPLQWHVYKLMIRCELLGGNSAPSLETSDAGFFEQDALPAVSSGRVLHRQLHRMFEHYRSPDLPADFD